MAIKIGHASLSENGTVTGVAGDSTGKEVCTRGWYNGGWQFVLRPTSSTLAEKSAKACEKGCANNKIGYDQNQRNTLNTQAKKVNYDLGKITTACETDCSAFMTVCAIAGGADIDYGSNAPTTSTMKSKFTKNKDYKVLTASKYLTNDKYLKRGDILVKAGSHTVMVLENGSKATTTTSSTTTSSTTNTNATASSIAKKKENIKSFQTWLNKYFNSGLTVDGAYGNNTKKASVKAWQQSSNELFNTSLAIDGDYGNASKKAASKIVIKKDSYNRFVYILQGMLNCHGYVCEFTGKCTSATVTQIKAFQRAKGLTADGVVGQNTWNKIFS